jgi:hypothetical protein
MNPSNLENISLSVNGRKVTTGLTDLNLFSDSLPPEAARLLISQLSLSLPENQAKAAPVEEVKVNIKETMSPEADNDIVKKEIEAYLKAKKEESSLVRSMPEHIQRAFDQKEALEQLRNEKELAKAFTIYESGVALGIVVGNSAKAEVVNIMTNYSKISFAADGNEPIHFYSDISLYVYFDEQDIVQELKFVNDYKGMTSKGLKLGDSIEKAIEIYSQPRMKSPKGAVWDRFAVFCDLSGISSIRLQK